MSILGECNYKIQGLYPILDSRYLGGYAFSIGIKKEFAKKCFEKELTQRIYDSLQDDGKKMLEKVFGCDEFMPLFDSHYPYKFVENKSGNLTCLISNLTVPGNACGLDSDFWEIESELKNIGEYSNFIEYHPHNIDTPIQCYALLSLLTKWDEIIETFLKF